MTRERDARTDLRAMLAVLGHEEGRPDRSFRDEPDPSALKHWRAVFEPLSDVATPLEPSPGLWRRIAAETTPESIAAKAPAETKRSRRPASGVSPWERLWSSVGLWRFSTAALASAALGFLLLADPLGQPAAPAPAPAYVAVLQAPEGDRDAGWIVEVAADRSVRLVPLRNDVAGEGRALEFWTKAADAAGPTSLGLVPGGAITRIAGGDVPPVGPDQLFEITLEPATGSPIGRPTGPILFVGRATAL